MSNDSVVSVPIENEMKQSYLDYAMSVIVSRALPDASDGLKPVHRRVLYAMQQAGLVPEKPHRKCATIVGDTIGKYHPHGDVAVYDTLVRMAQDFNLRYPLVDGHGNFGSVDGDPPAAYRYTEARLTHPAMEMLTDLDKDTVDFRPNFDNSHHEPVVLPARIPNLLVNGSAGIAVGMATNIPPHNLGEVIDACTRIIDEPGVADEELLKIIPAPDFPTGGLIMGLEGSRQAYLTGRGSVTMRARIGVEERKGGRYNLIITEIPYQVNKARLIEHIADLVRDKRITGITDLRDESDREGLRIVIELGHHVIPRVVINQLLKHTYLQQNFGIIMLALVDGVPRVLTLRECLNHFLEHRKIVIIRRTRFNLARARERAHILEGLQIAIDQLDEVITLIRNSRDAATAREGLIKKFGLSEIQAQAILDMRLQRLTGLEREKIAAEYKELIKTIAYLEDLLSSERRIFRVVKEELLEVKEKYADARRSEIRPQESREFELEDLIPDEEVVVTITNAGYVKRIPSSVYRSQRRGGRGIAGLSMKEEDILQHLVVTTTHKFLCFFTNRAKVYRLKVFELPEAGRTAKGTAAVNLLNLEPGERITALIPVPDFEEELYLMFATRKGIVNKTALREFANIHRRGIIACILDDDDELVGVRLTPGDEEIILVTRHGLSIRFPEEEVRSTGRNTRGVIGIRLDKGDQVVDMGHVQGGNQLLVVTTKGHGKRTLLKHYRKQARGGKGIKTIKLNPRIGEVVAARIIGKGREVIVLTREGTVIRMSVDGISLLGRDTQGVRLIRLEGDDEVVGLAHFPDRDDNDETPVYDNDVVEEEAVGAEEVADEEDKPSS